MIKFKKLLALLLVLAMTATLFAGCAKTPANDPANNSLNNNPTVSDQPVDKEPEVPAIQYPLEIVDTAGRTVVIEKEVESIIAMNSNCYTMIKALGAEDKIVGVGDAVAGAVPSAAERNLPAYGKSSAPNVEAVVAAQADIVIDYSYTDAEILKQLENAGVKVLLLDLYTPSTVTEETMKLGQALGHNEKATEIAEYIQSCETTITSRLSNIRDEDRATVYWEGYSDYSSVAPGTGGHEIIEIAGGRNIAENEDAKYPKVNDEWVLAKNPDVIIKCVSSKAGIMGEGCNDEVAVKDFYNTLTSRAGWFEMDAVKNGKVLMIAQNIGTTPEGYFIGALYLAKAMYPKELSDIDPYEMYREFQKKFLDTEVNGIIAYQGENSGTTAIQYPYEIVDTAGRTVVIEKKIESVIALNSNCYTMIKALGAEDKIVGIGNAVAAAVPSAAGRELPDYGSASKPNVEALLAAEADLIITYSYMDAEILAQLEAAGAKVLLLDLYIPSIVVEETLKLGKAMGLNRKAAEVAVYIQNCEKVIISRLADIADEDRATVYWEGYSDYSSVAPGTGGHEIIVVAGGRNIAENEDASYPKVNDEWVLTRDPDVIIKCVSSKNGIMGEGCNDEAAVKEFYDTIVSRPGWSEMEAVKNGRVLLIAQNIGTTPEGYFIGALYLAKIMYPEKLADVDPYEMYREFQRKFLDTEVNGIIAYQ